MGTALTVRREYAAPSAGTPVVTVRSGTSSKAPLLVEFEVDLSGCTFQNTANYDALFDIDYTGKVHVPERHRLVYAWDLGDPIDEWSAPENIPAGYVKRSRAFGANPSHVYTTAPASGMITWRLQIWEPSTGLMAWATGSFPITDSIETAEHIVLLNPNGDTDFSEFDATGLSATIHQYELNASNEFGNGIYDVDGAGGGKLPFDDHFNSNNVCWLFKTGGSYLVTANHQGSGNYFYHGQYGTTNSAKPIILNPNGTRNFQTNMDPAGVPELRIQNLHGQGDWTDYDTAPVEKDGGGFLDFKTGWRWIVADCTVNAIDGVFGDLDNAGTSTFPIIIGVANCEIVGIAGGEYPIRIGNTSAAPITQLTFVGNLYLDFDTLLSDSKQTLANTNHRAFIRINTPTHVHIRGNDFFRLAGAHGQPLLKINKAPAATCSISIQFCSAECSESFVELFPGDSAQTTPVHAAGIVECCVFIMLPMGTNIASAASTGNTLRSTLTVVPAWSDPNLINSDNITTPLGQTYRPKGFLLAGGQATYPAGNDAPNEAYNNHAINLRTPKQNGDKDGWGLGTIDHNLTATSDFGGTPMPYRNSGNFVHSPAQANAAATAFTPIKDDPTLESDGILRPDGTRMRCRFIGWNPAGTPDTTYSYNNQYVVSGGYEAGNAVIGAGVPPLTWPIDYLGRVCGPNRSAGSDERDGYAFEIAVQDAPA